MRYAMLIYSDQEPWFELSEEEAAKRSEESLPKWYAFFEELGAADPEMRGKELDDIRTAKTVRVRDGEVLISDGPFALLSDPKPVPVAVLQVALYAAVTVAIAAWAASRTDLDYGKG